jgi:hypothetical protein
VQINGRDVSPLEAMQLANALAGRNGIGMKHALENRIIGTKSRGVYEAPGMELLGTCLRYVYQATMDRRAGLLFGQLSKLVADQIYDGRYFDPVTQAARAAIGTFAKHASGTVSVGLYKGNIFFNALTGCKASIYNEADSSMEASDGLNPVIRRASLRFRVSRRVCWRGLVRSCPSKEVGMANLKASYLGLELKNPLVVSSNPLTDSVASVARLEAAGAAAVVMRSIFEEQINADVAEMVESLEGDTSMAALSICAPIPGPARAGKVCGKAQGDARGPLRSRSSPASTA